HHLDRATLRVLARAKGPAHTILVSDSSPLAGLPPGTYGEWAVDEAGKIVVAETPYLAGSNQGLETRVANLIRPTRGRLPDIIGTVTANPARLLGRTEPAIADGEPANLVTFRLPAERGFVLERVCVDGEWKNCARGRPGTPASD